MFRPHSSNGRYDHNRFAQSEETPIGRVPTATCYQFSIDINNINNNDRGEAHRAAANIVRNLNGTHNVKRISNNGCIGCKCGSNDDSSNSSSISFFVVMQKEAERTATSVGSASIASDCRMSAVVRYRAQHTHCIHGYHRFVFIFCLSVYFVLTPFIAQYKNGMYYRA